jgi:hypothetical protein
MGGIQEPFRGGFELFPVHSTSRHHPTPTHPPDWSMLFCFLGHMNAIDMEKSGFFEGDPLKKKFSILMS